jgi:hypothetical protein
LLVIHPWRFTSDEFVLIQYGDCMPQGPKPFSTDWLNAPPASSEGHRRKRSTSNQRWVAFFSRLPGERALTLIALFCLIVSSFWFGGPRGEAQSNTGANVVAQVPKKARVQYDTLQPTAAADISTESLKVNTGGGVPAGSPPVLIPELNLETQETEEQPLTAGGIFPNNRVLAFYGFPGNTNMGILGEYDKARLLERLREQAKAYEEADPEHPVILAFEVIASVAQNEPQDDGSYVLDTDSALLDEYAEFTGSNGLLLILDVQIGYRTVANEILGLKPWLSQNHVHLALDPEFAMEDGQIPGEHIGQIDAEDITFAQKWLVDLSAEVGGSPKMLVVHQFQQMMITNKDLVEPMTGVQLVINADGWGVPDNKRATYDFVNRVTHVEYHGIKLFYLQDVPLMEPAEIVNLDPAPLLVVYH